MITTVPKAQYAQITVLGIASKIIDGEFRRVATAMFAIPTFTTHAIVDATLAKLPRASPGQKLAWPGPTISRDQSKSARFVVRSRKKRRKFPRPLPSRKTGGQSASERPIRFRHRSSKHQVQRDCERSDENCQ